MNDALKQLRVKHLLSQTEMAERLHMSQSAYSKLENERTSLRKEIILILINQFGSSAEQVLLTDEMQNILKEKVERSLQNDFVSKEMYAQQKEVFEKILAEKDREIARLTAVVERFTLSKKSITH